jgi:hypothetical protein
MADQQKLNLRCSALPLAVRCPGSIRPSKVAINASHEAADDGTAAHAILKTLPRAGQIDWDSIPTVAKEHGANPDETRMLCAMGVKLWGQVKASFQGAFTETRVEKEVAPGIVLTGHADIAAVSERALRGADWKTGRKDRDHAHQLKGYAALMLLSSEDFDEVTWTGLWVRTQEIENYTMNRAGAERWLSELVARVVNWDGVFHPGSHCAHCPRNHECEAANALLRRDLAVIADRSLIESVEFGLDTMTPAEQVAIFRKADLVVDFAQRVRAAVKAHVEAHGDIVADGVRLTVTEETRRELDPLKAWPLLEAAGFTDEDFARAMTIGISKVEKVMREKAGKGQGAGAVRELDAKLRAAGAISTSTTTKLQEKRA